MEFIDSIRTLFLSLVDRDTMIQAVKVLGITGWVLAAVAVAIWMMLRKGGKPQAAAPGAGPEPRPAKKGNEEKREELGVTLGRFGDLLRERDAELNSRVASLKDKDVEARNILEKQRELIQGKLAGLDMAYRKRQGELLDVGKALHDFRHDFFPEQLEKARTELEEGETETAEFLLRQVLGEGTPQAAEASYHLGILSESNNEYLWALQYFYYAAQLRPDNPAYLAAAGEIAYALGQYDEAENFVKHMLKERQLLLGSEHPEVAQIINNLGVICHTQGKAEMAEALYQWAVEIDEYTLGPDHPKVAIYLENFAALLREQGREAEALPLEARIREIQEKEEQMKAEKGGGAEAGPGEVVAAEDAAGEEARKNREAKPGRKKK